MKKPPAVAPSPSRAPWGLIATFSLLANAGLIGWLVARSPKPAEPVAAVAPPAAVPVQTWTRELAPYAALGSFMAENNRVADLKWSAAQFAAFQEGFRASYEGRGLPLDDAAAKLRDETSARVQAMAQVEQPDPVRDYFRLLREKENVLQTASGLHYRITEEGTGTPPAAADTVIISYAARLPDGTAIPALGRTRVKVAVRDLLPGLAEGVQLLRGGGKALIYVPPALAFREADWPAVVPKGVPLAFFVELHDINPPR
jgi:FKBP-type peptidyl-prolyl cis-trans isomerase FkpA